MKGLKNAKFLAVFAVVLIVASALVAGCINPMKIPDGMDSFVGDAKWANLPEGMGAVRLNFGNSTARTLLPEDNKTINSFDSFTLIFTPKGGGTAISRSIDLADVDEEVLVPYGEYTLRVLGYTAGTTLMASASTAGGGITTTGSDLTGNPKDGFEIVEDDLTEIRIILRAIIKGEGSNPKGTLDYNIDISYSDADHGRGQWMYDDAFITATPYPDGTKPVQWKPLNVSSGDPFPNTVVNSQNYLSLTPGYYWVDILINARISTPPSGNIVLRGLRFRQFAHIYQNMSTPFGPQTIYGWMFRDDLTVDVPDPEEGSGGVWIDYVRLNDKIGVRFEDSNTGPVYEEDGVIQIEEDYVKITITDPDGNPLPAGTVFLWLGMNLVTGAENPLAVTVTGNTVYVAKSDTVSRPSEIDPSLWVVPSTYDIWGGGIFPLSVLVDIENELGEFETYGFVFNFSNRS
jgi:outer membrane murein-binding lipoprotein Lpp